MEKIVITGGSGFIATNMIEYFLDKGYYVYSLTKFTQASFAKERLTALEKSNKRFKNYWVDLTDYIKTTNILNEINPEQIIHLAAEADVSQSYDYPTAFMHTNLMGTYNLLEWIRNYSLNTRMLYFSTDEVVAEPSHAVKEDEPLNPKNPYSASKAATEMYIKAWNNAFDTKVQIIRLSNNYGPYQGTNRLIAKIILRALTNTPFELFKGTSFHKRHWLYVEDTCRATELIIRKGNPTGIYNVTSKDAYTVEEVKDIILGLLHKEKLFKGWGEVRYKDDITYQLDGSKLYKLGWKQKYSFKEGIKKTIAWYKAHTYMFPKEGIETGYHITSSKYKV